MRKVPQFEVSRKATWLKSFSQAMTSLVGQHEALPREHRTSGLLMERTKHPLRGTVEGAIRRTLFSKLQRSPSRACTFSNLPIQLY